MKKEMLSNETLLKCVLKQLHLRQSDRLAGIPKVLSEESMPDQTVLVVRFLRDVVEKLINEVDSGLSISYLERAFVIPFVDELLFRIESKAADCDAIIFHVSPSTSFINGCDMKMLNMYVKMATTNLPDFQAVETQIEITFTPVWTKEKKRKKPIYHISEM